jgi:hypothetical protein
MLPQEVFSVIVTIRGSGHYVNMLSCRHIRRESGISDRPLVIELDQNDRAMNAIVKHCVICRLTDPGEIGIVQVLQYFFHTHLRLVLTNAVDEELDQID